jgi:hypothetical protein
MKITLKLEELAMTAIAIYFLSIHNLGISFWWWSLIFFSPDISMLGYLLNTRVGAISYNLFHHKGVALVTMGIGYYLHVDLVTAIGILLFAHSSFDRTMGYGLKYPESFKNTHLGTL